MSRAELTKVQSQVLEATKALLARGESPSDANLAAMVPGVPKDKMRTLYGRLATLGLVASRLSTPRPVRPWEPCVKCGDPNGYTKPGKGRPTRLRGERWGLVGWICVACHYKFLLGNEASLRDDIEDEDEAVNATAELRRREIDAGHNPDAHMQPGATWALTEVATEMLARRYCPEPPKPKIPARAGARWALSRYRQLMRPTPN